MSRFAALASRYRHRYLLFILLLVISKPLVVTSQLGDILTVILLGLAMGAAVYSEAATRRRFRRFIVLGVLAIAARGVSEVSGTHAWEVIALSLWFLFFADVTVAVLRKVFADTRRVTADTISGAVAAYLLFGVCWAFAYSLLEMRQPGSFTFPPGRVFDTGPFEHLLGFSYTTLTSLGYGNIAPATPRADALTTLQAIIGQLYLTVLVARLVGIHISQSMSSSNTDTGS